jgi:hypothetical protein
LGWSLGYLGDYRRRTRAGPNHGAQAACPGEALHVIIPCSLGPPRADFLWCPLRSVEVSAPPSRGYPRNGAASTIRKNPAFLGGRNGAVRHPRQDGA